MQSRLGKSWVAASCVSLVFIILAGFLVFGGVSFVLAGEPAHRDGSNGLYVGIPGVISGMFFPGQTCTSNTQCASGACSCTKMAGQGTVCCSYPARAQCTQGWQCVSGNCVGGLCTSGTRADGAACSTDQDCTSGKCKSSVGGGAFVCVP